MDRDGNEKVPLSFQVVDAHGVESTLELVETFRLEVNGRLRDYCLVRELEEGAVATKAPAPGSPEPDVDDDLDEDDEDEDDDEDDEVERERAPDQGAVLQAFRLEDSGLASLEPGAETLLIGQALMALQNVVFDGRTEEPVPGHDDDEAQRALRH